MVVGLHSETKSTVTIMLYECLRCGVCDDWGVNGAFSMEDLERVDLATLERTIKG